MFRVALIALALSGCVTAKTQMLDDRTAIISGRGSGYSSAADVYKKVLVAAATTAQERGYSHFQITGTQDATTQGAAVFRNPTTTNVAGNALCTGAWCSGTATANTYGGGGTIIPVIRPGADIVIRLLNEGEFDPGAQGVFRAESVLAEAARK